MFDAFLSQMLVIFLLFVCCFRTFFSKTSRIDSAAILAPVAFLISILNIFLWNLNVPNIFLLCLSLLVMLSNLRALIRLSARVFVDRYSAASVIFSILELILVIFVGTVIFLNRPVKLTPQDFNSVKTKSRLSGNASRGFKPIAETDFFRSSTGTLYTYRPKHAEEENQQQPIILFCGTDIAEVQDYEPYFLFLSSKGYEVLAADFYASDMEYLPGVYNSRFLRKTFSLHNFLKSKNNLKNDTAQTPQTEQGSQAGDFSNPKELNKINSYKALTKLASSLYGTERTFFYIFDSLSFEQINRITEDAGSQLNGYFCLNQIPEYKTAGLGFIEQTDVFIAGDFELKRDASLFIPRYVSNKTLNVLKQN